MPRSKSLLFKPHSSLSIFTLRLTLTVVSIKSTAEMLAVFDRTVAESPEGLRSGDGGCGARSVVENFSAVNAGSVTVSLGSNGALAYSAANQNNLIPRLFASVDGIFCLFKGHIENIATLKQQYGLNKAANEVIIVIEAYKTLRDRGPYPAAQVIRDLHGKFAFILFDSSSKSAFIAADADGSFPFFWGSDSAGNLVFSDSSEIVKEGCGKSFAPFPKGCFFTTSGGLQSFEHPQKEMKAMPRVDSQGQVCGATYKVDAESRKDSAFPRVDSAANWSSQY